MKKVLVLLLVLVLAGLASAAVVSLDIIGGDTPAGDFGGIPSYEGSSTIIIGVTADFYVANFNITRVTTDNDGTASNPQLHTRLTEQLPWNHGDLVNSGGVLVKDVAGTATAVNVEDGIPAGETLWQFEYHVPELPYSTIIEIALDDITVSDAWYMDYVEGDIGPLEIHVSPEPMTVALLGLGGLFLRRRR